MDWRLLVSKVRQTMARDGLLGVVSGFGRMIAARRSADEFDARHGVDTGGTLHLWNFTVQAASVESAETAGRYQPMDEPSFRASMEFLQGRQAGFTFVDIGTGKGRPLIMAGWLGFGRVVGVEFAVELADIARANLAKLGIANAEVVTLDASIYRFPDEPQIVFMTGATLGPTILAAVLDNLAKVSREHEVHVVYIRPYSAAVLDGHPDFEAADGACDPLMRRWRLRSPSSP